MIQSTYRVRSRLNPFQGRLRPTATDVSYLSHSGWLAQGSVLATSKKYKYAVQSLIYRSILNCLLMYATLCPSSVPHAPLVVYHCSN